MDSHVFPQARHTLTGHWTQWAFEPANIHFVWHKEVRGWNRVTSYQVMKQHLTSFQTQHGCGHLGALWVVCGWRMFCCRCDTHCRTHALWHAVPGIWVAETLGCTLNIWGHSCPFCVAAYACNRQVKLTDCFIHPEGKVVPVHDPLKTSSNVTLPALHLNESCLWCCSDILSYFVFGDKMYLLVKEDHRRQ